ncbi:MAG: hypothetical protein OXN25_19995 [Candidatus Poribacteria bacterium]|nr:hypothetical protein [Candidatus Poribacteria bacterium]
MKNSSFLYCIITFALMGIFIIFIFPEIIPTSTNLLKQQVPVETKMTGKKKKACGCCEDREKRRQRFEKIIQDVHARSQVKKQSVNITAP